MASIWIRQKSKPLYPSNHPSLFKNFQKFLSFSNFYRRFIQDFSKIARPLNDLLRKGNPWHWGWEQQAAFTTLKHAFVQAPTLAHFNYNKKSVLETDASDWATGGILSQYDDNGILWPVAYFSSKHSLAECNYKIYDKELLAINQISWGMATGATGNTGTIQNCHRP